MDELPIGVATGTRSQHSWHKLCHEHLDKIGIFDILEDLVTRLVGEETWPTNPTRRFLELLRHSEMKTYAELRKLHPQSKLNILSSVIGNKYGDPEIATIDSTAPMGFQRVSGLTPHGSNGLSKLMLARVESPLVSDQNNDLSQQLKVQAVAYAYRHILGHASPEGLAEMFDVVRSLERDTSTTAAKLREPSGYKMTVAVAAIGARGALHGYMSGIAVDGAHGGVVGCSTPAASAWRLHDFQLEVCVHVGPASKTEQSAEGRGAVRGRMVSFERAVNLFAQRVMKDAFAAAAAHFTFLQRIHISGTGSQVEWSLDDINDSKEMFFTAVKGAAVAKESLWLDLIHVMTPTSGQHPHVPSLLRIRRYYTFYYTDGNDLLRVFSPTKFNALGCGIFFNEDDAEFFAKLAQKAYQDKDTGINTDRASVLVLRDCLEGLASKVVTFSDAGKTLDALEALAVYILLQKGVKESGATDKVWEEILK